MCAVYIATERRNGCHSGNRVGIVQPWNCSITGPEAAAAPHLRTPNISPFLSDRKVPCSICIEPTPPPPPPKKKQKKMALDHKDTRPTPPQLGSIKLERLSPEPLFHWAFSPR